MGSHKLGRPHSISHPQSLMSDSKIYISSALTSLNCRNVNSSDFHANKSAWCVLDRYSPNLVSDQMSLGICESHTQSPASNLLLFLSLSSSLSLTRIFLSLHYSPDFYFILASFMVFIRFLFSHCSL